MYGALSTVRTRAHSVASGLTAVLGEHLYEAGR
jgi:hypothetical protein